MQKWKWQPEEEKIKIPDKTPNETVHNPDISTGNDENNDPSSQKTTKDDVPVSKTLKKYSNTELKPNNIETKNKNNK